MEQSFKPSKQFIIRGSIAIGIVAIVLIVQTAWFRKLFHRPAASTFTDQTVGDLVTKDSNQNGIADWEEKLWGLDPTVLYTNGIPNKQLIEDKKKALGIQPTDDENLDNTDRVARQLFAITAALSQSDTIDDAALSDIARKLGASVDVADVSNRYLLENIHTTQTTVPGLRAYYASLKKILGDYSKNASEIDVLVEALQNEDTSRLPELAKTAVIYNQYAADMGKLNVPIGLAKDHLAIMNGFAGMATSFSYISKLDDDGISAMIGMAIYKNSSTKLNTAFTNMRDYLTRYGILS